jgi:hypothetical protein
MRFARRVLSFIRGRWIRISFACGACGRRYSARQGGFFWLDRHLCRHDAADFAGKEHGDIVRRFP